MLSEFLRALIPLVALSIPIIAIVLSHRGSTQKNKIKELELQKEILELETKKQNDQIILLQEENKKYDRLIYEETKKGGHAQIKSPKAPGVS